MKKPRERARRNVVFCMTGVHWWVKTPFVRLLAGLTTGILLQWYVQPALWVIQQTAAFLFASLLIYHFFSVRTKFRVSYLSGVLVLGLMACLGAWMIWQEDIRNDPDWIGRIKEDHYLTVALEEPLVEKTNSYKAEAGVQKVNSKETRRAKGRIIIYFKKDSLPAQIGYGSLLLIKKPLQRIRNSGNPASFDYENYCLFAGITHQVYLRPKDFTVLSGSKTSFFRSFVLDCRQWTISTIRKYIRGEKEMGLAEALLIGYKDDLDKNLVQAYSNTGVVHVIAISGLHLGLIYWLLLLLTKPLSRKKLVWLRMLVVISCLWLFSMLAGGQPSVLRSAVMFTCLATGEVLSRRGSVFNTLALSAFVLLCINPYWLWDAGFQLSFAAMLSILVFYRPVYNWFYFSNPLVDFFWKLNAVTMAAQLLTAPVSIFHFHQFPNFFLFTNFLAVPLSSLILIGEILLCFIFFIEPLAVWLGRILTEMIRWMNGYIERLDGLRFSVWEGLYVDLMQTLLLSVFILAFCFWLMEKNKKLLFLALFCFLFFTLIRSLAFIRANRQHRLVVYHVPKHSAMDIMQGRQCYFTGDSALVYDEYLKNFHIKPSRVAARVSHIRQVKHRLFQLAGKTVMILDTSWQLPVQKKVLDLLILTKNARLDLTTCSREVVLRQVIIDGSVPAWKARLWKKDCDSLQIPCHEVTEQGAFVTSF